MREIIFEKSLISKTSLLIVIQFMNHKLSFSIPFSFEKSSFILFILTSLYSFSVLNSILEVSLVRVLNVWVLEMPLSMKIPFFKSSLIGNSIDPLKLAFSIFLSETILTLINAFVIIFYSHSFRLLVLPVSFVFEASDLVVKNTLPSALPDEIAGVRIDVNGFIQIWLKVFRDIALEVALKIAIFLDFVDLRITFRQFILIFGISIHVDDVDWMFDHPYFVLACCYFGKFANSFPNMHVGDWKRAHLNSILRKFQPYLLLDSTSRLSICCLDSLLENGHQYCILIISHA